MRGVDNPPPPIAEVKERAELYLYFPSVSLKFVIGEISLFLYIPQGGCCGGRNSSVGIATGYGLDCTGIESRWGARFSAPEAHPASYTRGTAFFLGVQRPERGVHHPSPSSIEVKERVQLYICSPSEPSWLVTGWTLHFFSFTYLHGDATSDFKTGSAMTSDVIYITSPRDRECRLRLANWPNHSFSH